MASLPDDRVALERDQRRDSAGYDGRDPQAILGDACGISACSMGAHRAASVTLYSRQRPSEVTGTRGNRCASDLGYFDYALVNGGADIHAQALRFPLVRVTSDGRWRLYKVTTGRR